MELNIIEHYTELNYEFKLETDFKKMFIKKVEENLFSFSELAKIKAKYFELLICTDGINPKLQIKSLSKTDKNKYFTFQFWLPYAKIMETENYLLTFVDYVFEGLIQVFEPYKVSEKLIRQVQTNIKNEVLQNPKLYEYVEPEYEKHIRAALEKWNKNQAEKQNLANGRS